MKIRLNSHHLFTFLLFLPVAVLGAKAPDEDKPLVSFGEDFDLKSLELQDAEVRLISNADGQMLHISTGSKSDWPGVTISAPEGGWDLSAFGRLSMSVMNTGDEPVTVNCRVDSPGDENRATEHITVKPNESALLVIPLTPRLPDALKDKLFGMRGNPGGMAKDKGFFPKQVSQLIIFVNKPKRGHAFQVGDIRVEGEALESDWANMDAESFFPMIDELGQFMHGDWPGKMDSVTDLKNSVQLDDQDLASHPGPEDWNQYGGWNGGPQLTATGFFYAKKVGSMWWLVDPEGRLFWSHGVDCVGHQPGTTPITDREFYFADLPAKDSPLAIFYGRGSWAPHGYYKDKGSYRTYCLQGANLMRKYGADWQHRIRAMPPSAAQLVNEYHRQLVGPGHLSDAKNALRGFH